MKLPRIRSIRRWRIRPGDRLVLNLADLPSGELPRETAEDIAANLRQALNLPPDFPVVILPSDASLSVYSAPSPSSAPPTLPTLPTSMPPRLE